MADASPAEVQRKLEGISYPASKQELIQHAQEQEAPDSILSALRMLPERQFSSPTEVSQAVGAIQ